MTISKVLADHADYRITLHRALEVPSTRLVITFGGQPSDLADKGFGTPFCMEQGFDNIYVAQRHGTQYQALSVEDFRKSVYKYCEGRDVITYGSSLGGYAAVYYGGCVNARIIAAAPMLPAWPPLKLKAYEGFEVRHKDIQFNSVSNHKPFILFDPKIANDVRLINELIYPAYPDINAIKVPYGGHTVLVTLSQARLLKPMILSIIKSNQVHDFVPPGEGTAIYHGERGRELIPLDKQAACNELQKSIEINPSKRYFGILVNLLIRMGKLDAAQDLIDHGNRSGDSRFMLVPSVLKLAETNGLRVKQGT